MPSVSSKQSAMSLHSVMPGYHPAAVENGRLSASAGLTKIATWRLLIRRLLWIKEMKGTLLYFDFTLIVVTSECLALQHFADRNVSLSGRYTHVTTTTTTSSELFCKGCARINMSAASQC